MKIVKNIFKLTLVGAAFARRDFYLPKGSDNQPHFHVTQGYVDQFGFSGEGHSQREKNDFSRALRMQS